MQLSLTFNGVEKGRLPLLVGGNVVVVVEWGVLLVRPSSILTVGLDAAAAAGS